MCICGLICKQHDSWISHEAVLESCVEHLFAEITSTVAHAYATAGTLIQHYALLKLWDKKYVLNKYKISRVTNGMTVHIWINIFDLSFSELLLFFPSEYIECSVTLPYDIS